MNPTRRSGTVAESGDERDRQATGDGSPAWLMARDSVADSGPGDGPQATGHGRSAQAGRRVMAAGKTAHR